MTDRELIKVIKGLPSQGTFTHDIFHAQWDVEHKHIADYADLKRLVTNYEALLEAAKWVIASQDPEFAPLPLAQPRNYGGDLKTAIERCEG